ncbi:MAG: type II toxin-antitoxin system RelE/ParE family toxin [Robiginitomaculum sp.]|nr:type II toxin-antitoxin system RelE/ParE family toxin [Robiginitomaculum sp.]
MKWTVEFHPAFEDEFDKFSDDVQDSILGRLELLARIGHQLARPYCDTLKGSRHANMKELRCDADNGVWRIAFAFDPDRKAIVLTAGNKAGANQKRFYKTLIKTADTRFDEHLSDIKGKR